MSANNASTALITGINGQDGSYLADQLLAKGVEVHGILRAEALKGVDGRDANIRHLYGKAKRVLGWQPQKPFEEMVREMVESDIAQLKSPT